MSRVYAPDLWQVVKLNYDGDVIYKILGSWYGGYAGSDSWRMSSGIVSVKDDGDNYEVLNESGSSYACYKKCEGMSGYTGSVYHSFLKQAEESEGKLQIELVSISDLLNQFPITKE